jgi:hypothetical protein
MANAIFVKRPLCDYIKGQRVHGGNEAYFFGYILWLLKPQIHQYLAEKSGYKPKLRSVIQQPASEKRAMKSLIKFKHIGQWPIER